MSDSLQSPVAPAKTEPVGVSEVPMQKNPERRIIGLLVCGLLAMVAGVGIFFETQHAMIDRNWSSAVGIIVKIEPHEIRNAPGKLTEYEYEVEGAKHVGHYFLRNEGPDKSLPEPTIGKKLELRFSPANPAENQLRRKPNWILATVLTAGFLGTIGLGIWFFLTPSGKSNQSTKPYDATK